MALLDRDNTGHDGKGPMDGIDRRLLVVALALALLTLLAVLDQYRPTPGSAPPVDWQLPSAELSRTVPMAKAPSLRPDELLGAD
ncbi:hypothetical protein J2848_005311 [Azospirillum lipoferum]|uniref:Uncharacterized protein n=1 Tax=Azospirillum lipoferum TaxID=193 RepID=A0A5A9GHK7_AZOLI|nr:MULTISPECIES: hypothetical protein [Azospirillum]KAA0593204.1 hypothetical protein FZ942_25045 [Azospirillum lipoferum]MCP1613615.1 hypothetical protein [Azospirillum lipoferum]MDW5532377.1 hypothetical protein [Azospirillum sp. NL1]